MKRWTFLALVALIGGALHAETLFDAIDLSKEYKNIKKIKAQVEVMEADVNATLKDESAAGWEKAGYTPLVYAINTLSDQTRIDAVKYLLEHKANPNAKCAMKGGLNSIERTALSAAVLKNDLVVVKMLLDAGADPTLPIRCSNFLGGSTPKTRFGDTYDNNQKLKVNALDIAVAQRSPAMVDALKAKAPKLAATYNTGTLWYTAYVNDLVGFKKAIKAGAKPDDYDVAYLIHYGKQDFVNFVDAAMAYGDASNGFNIVDDSPDVATICAYFDKNIDLLVSDSDAFKTGMLTLNVNWEKYRSDPQVLNFQWSISTIAARFTMRPEIEELLENLFKTLDVKPVQFER